MQNRKQRRIAAWLAAMFFLPAASQAANLSLDEALNAAQKYSAALSANQHQVNALENMADSATQLPDPKLKFGIENVPVGGDNGRRLTREGMTMQRVGIMQDYVSSENESVRPIPCAQKRLKQRLTRLPFGLSYSETPHKHGSIWH